MTFRFGQLVQFTQPGSPFHGRLARVEDYWWSDAPPVVRIRFVPLEGEAAPTLSCGEEALVAADMPKEEGPR